MQVPVRWLSEYVDIDGIKIGELEDKLIMSGSNTEYVVRTMGQVEGIRMGKILSIDQHPDADKLKVCQVGMGDDTIQIVTNAQNVEVGRNIPVAVHGSKLSDGTKIKKGKLRNVESYGMFCSFAELGFDDKVIPKEAVEGILNFREEYPSGGLISEAQPEFDDDVILFEITPNRPDCLSIMGMAREASATFKRPMKKFETIVKGNGGNAADHISIEISDSDLCSRYMGRVARNVRIGESPDWMKIRLMKAGMRPINNIVDISNYVMLELGQPTHAFDLDTLKGGKIVVRRAKDGEKLTTLDGVERALGGDMLVIADGERGVAIAGVMGGEDTEVRESTVNILIESATFDKTSVRKTSRDLGLRSEASSRFEKGVAPELAELAVNRVCQLIEELGIGEVVDGAVDAYPVKAKEFIIPVSVSKINKYIGIDLAPEEMADILTSLQLGAALEGDSITVTVPYFRLDLQTPIDIVEEVARIYGYDRIPTSIPSGKEYGAKTERQRLQYFVRNLLIAEGMYETLTYSFISPSALDHIMAPANDSLRNVIRLMNPLGEEYSVMRTSLLPNALEIIARNYKFKVESARIFEIGNVFIPDDSAPELTKEMKKLVLSSYGETESFFTMKGTIENLLTKLGIRGARFEKVTDNTSFHPGRCAKVIAGDVELGIFGEIHPLVLENYDIRVRSYAGEFNFELMMDISNTVGQFRHLPKFPAVSRDIAILIDDEKSHSDIEAFVMANGGKDLQGLRLFDVYKGKQIEDGFKSMAYSMTYRNAEKTLTDEEVNAQFDKLVKKLEEFGAKLR